MEAIKNTIKNAPQFIIISCGSVLEMLLISFLSRYPEKIKTAAKLPKRKGILQNPSKWDLYDLIEVSCEIKLIRYDTMEACHSFVRKFRNQVHPTLQIENNFVPDHRTVELCFMAMQRAIDDLSKLKTE